MDLNQNYGSDEYTYYRGRKEVSRKHSGIKAAMLACVVELMQNLVFSCIGVTFVDYFLKSLHYSVAESSNMVTNFMGIAYLLSIVWGFISDTYFTRFTTFMFYGTLELMALIILTYQAYNPHLQPPENKNPSLIQVGGTKTTLPPHGADQLDPTNQNQISSYFNWYFCSISLGALLGATIMVWIEENHGWTLYFIISAIILSFSPYIFAAGFPLYRHKHPAGSSLSRIIKVFVALTRNPQASNIVSLNHSVTEELLQREQSHEKFKFLNQALIDPNIGVAEVEETKSFLGLLPIFATTILMNCVVAQLQTFSVQQGDFMKKNFHNFTIPTQSLVLFPIIMVLTFISLFEHLKHKQRHQANMNNKIYQPLARIGMGLALVSVSMGVAAIIEAMRLEAVKHDQILSVFWLLWQYIFLGISNTLSFGGMVEFFYTEAPDSMRSICTSLSWLSSSMGFFLSSMLVAICNSISGRFGREWFGGKDLNHSRLDLFYALLCFLNFINFLLYVYFAKRY